MAGPEVQKQTSKEQEPPAQNAPAEATKEGTADLLNSLEKDLPKLFNELITKITKFLQDLGLLAKIQDGTTEVKNGQKNANSSTDKQNKPSNEALANALELAENEYPSSAQVIENIKNTPNKFLDSVAGEKCLIIGDSNTTQVAKKFNFFHQDPNLKPHSSIAEHKGFKNTDAAGKNQHSYAIGGTNSNQHRQIVDDYLNQVKGYKNSGKIERAIYCGGINNSRATNGEINNNYWKNLGNIEHIIAELTKVFGRGNVVLVNWPDPPQQSEADQKAVRYYNQYFAPMLATKYGVKIIDQQAAQPKTLHPNANNVAPLYTAANVVKGDGNNEPLSEEVQSRLNSNKLINEQAAAQEYEQFIQQYKKKTGLTSVA